MRPVFPALAFPAFCAATLLGAAGNDWPAYLGDAGATHYSTLTQLTPRNVSRLTPAWTYHAGGADANNRSQIQCNPLVIDGVLYGRRRSWRCSRSMPRRAVNCGASRLSARLAAVRRG